MTARASRICVTTGAASRNSQNGCILRATTDENRTELRNHAARTSCNCLVCIDATPLPREKTYRDLSRPKFVEVNSPYCRCNPPFGTLPVTPSESYFEVIHRAGIKHQSTDAPSRLATTGESRDPIKYVSIVSISETASENKSNIQLVLHTHTRPPASPETEPTYGRSLKVEDNEAEKGKAAHAPHMCLHHQATGAFCKQSAENVEQAKAEYINDKNGLIDRIAFSDGAAQEVVHRALQSRLLCPSRYSVVIDHPRQRWMYGSMRRELY